MKTPLTTLLGAASCLLVTFGSTNLALAQGAPQVYDLKADWSEIQNPNGAWTYRGGESLLLDTLAPWTASDSPGPVLSWSSSTPVITKSLDFFMIEAGILNGTVEPGDLVVSGVGTNVLWTAPADGTISVAGGFWSASVYGPYLNTIWALERNGIPLSAGVILPPPPPDLFGDSVDSISGSEEIYDRNSPYDLSLGSGGEAALLNVPVTGGDHVALHFNTNEAIALNYTITFTPEAAVNETPIPTIHAPSSGSLAAVGAALTFEGSIVDDDPAGTHTAEWIVSSPTMPETSIPGTVNGYSVSDPIEFTEAGVYSIKLVVTDPHGATGQATTVLNELPAYVVVYDPDGGFVTGGGWVNSPPGSFYPALAHSVDDWDSTGEQGANGWTYGYREVPLGGAIDYNPAADFTPFPDDWWTGRIWDEPDVDGDHLPWTFIGPVAGHPNWNPHHWAIRRWVSDVSGEVDITHHIAKAHTDCGNGATGAVHHNGVRIGALVAEATDGTFASQVVTTTVNVGDTIDFILSPVGTDGIVDDSCDTSYFGGSVAAAGTADYAQMGGWASFGFFSKYKKGATVPTGQTEFQYHLQWATAENTGNMNFQSSSYDWLVVAGAKAQFKGVGTINGEGKYGFMVTATDSRVPGGGDADRFRIKIWDLATEVIVYDNQVGSDDHTELNDSTVIQGGNIVVHK